MNLGSLRVLLRGRASACLQTDRHSLCCSIFPFQFNQSSLGASSYRLSTTIMRTVSSSSRTSTPPSSNSQLDSVSVPTAKSRPPDFNSTTNDQIISRLNVDADHYHSGDRVSEEQLVVCVEGNIGCGKTTLLKYFENMGGCEISAEPVDKWRNVADFNPLAMMYSDPSRWAMALQTYIQLTMLQIHTSPMKSRVRLMERSIFSAKHCFVDNLYKSGTMHEMEYIVLSKWFNWIVEHHNIKVDLIVYLRTDPVQLHERIMKRCRQEEKSIPVEYLQSLHQLHEDWLFHKKIPCPADVLVLDANTSLEQMKLVYEQHKSNILNARLKEAQTS